MHNDEPLAFIPPSQRNSAVAYFPALSRKGIPLTQRHKEAAQNVVEWLNSQRARGRFNSMPHDPEARVAYKEALKREYAEQAYGNAALIIAGIVIKLIISMIIDHYFS